MASVVSAVFRMAAPGVAAKVNFGTTESNGVPNWIESWLYTNPVSSRSSILKVAFASPGKLSLAAKRKVDSWATDEVVVVLLLFLQPLTAMASRAMRMGIYRFIFCVIKGQN